MQYANFIRDIDEDRQLGRRYLPSVEPGIRVEALTPSVAAEDPRRWWAFVQYHVDLYRQWAEEAAKGLKHMPWRARVAVRTAHDTYSWTARKIERDPTLVFRTQLKPAPWQVVLQGVWNMMRLLRILLVSPM